MDRAVSNVRVLTFDIFGTVLDLSGSIVPALRGFLAAAGSALDPGALWDDWRARQRLEQHQDTILMLGHKGYLDSARRALCHTLRRHGIPYDTHDALEVLKAFERLQPFDDAREGLGRLRERYMLVALSNGDLRLLEALAGSIADWPFDRWLSVDRVGRFKPHPSVYRMASKELEREPGEIMMVASHAFDILGARACGYRGAYVNRYRLPYDESSLLPDLEVSNFEDLADTLLGE